MAELIVCSIGAAFSFFLMFFAKGFPKSIKPGVPSASFFPMIIAVILLGLSIYNIIMTLIRLKKAKTAGAYEKVQFNMGKVLHMVEIIVLMALYATLWSLHLGHFLLNSIVIFSGICVLSSDEVKWYKSVFFSTCLVLFIYALFTWLLKVRLW